MPKKQGLEVRIAALIDEYGLSDVKRCIAMVDAYASPKPVRKAKAKPQPKPVDVTKDVTKAS